MISTRTRHAARPEYKKEGSGEKITAREEPGRAMPVCYRCLGGTRCRWMAPVMLEANSCNFSPGQARSKARAAITAQPP